MGNCIRKEPPMQWAGDDWGSPASETLFSGDKATKMEEDDRERLSVSSSSSSSTEVKIKITKKQLEELLGRADVEGLSVEQLLVQLMNGSDRFETHPRSWRPALKSIPEVD